MQELIYEGVAGLITITSIVSLFLPRHQKGHAPGSLQDDGQVASEMRLGGSV